MNIGIIGAGTMGAGIAQIAATFNHKTVLFDAFPEAIEKAKAGHQKILARLVEKERITEEEKINILDNITYATQLNECKDCDLIIEAVIEKLDLKKQIFKDLEELVKPQTILATNTSSLSVASIAGACKKADRVLGIHFFNPAPLMPLVEIVPAIQTSDENLQKAKALIDSWKKVTVITKDTPGFIVNRVARPFYGEALRLYEEGFGSFSTIDWAMKELGGFRMGPFELMDFIGNDVNYAVTETVFAAFYYDQRYKPSFTQKRHAEAGWLGRKSSRGYYDYAEGAEKPQPNTDNELGENIVWRILVMLINEAADALYLNIASKEDIDLAMTKGVNYPKGLLQWADEKGIQHCVDTLDRLHNEYLEDRYRCSPLLRKMAKEGRNFYA